MIKRCLLGLLCCTFLLIAGCSGTTSSGSSGGYNISISSSQSIVSTGGTATFTAFVTDSSGNGVTDTTNKVSFSSQRGGTFSVGGTATNLVGPTGGYAQILYTAPTSTGTNWITATYRSTNAACSITVN